MATAEEIVIRPANAADCELLLGLIRELASTTFSSFECRSGIWLEDVYVRPEHRRGGIGRRLMEYLAALALERGHVRFEWCALDWNEPALSFYAGLGARRLDEWTTLRLEAPEIEALAAGV